MLLIYTYIFCSRGLLLQEHRSYRKAKPYLLLPSFHPSSLVCVKHCTKYQGHKDKSLTQHFPTLDTLANPSLYQKKQGGVNISKKSGSDYSLCFQYFLYKVKHWVALQTCIKETGPISFLSGICAL